MSRKDLETSLHEWLKEEILKSGIFDFQININASGREAEGFTGTIIFFEVNGKDSVGTSKKFHYVLKKGVENDKKVPISKMYGIEIDFYRKIFPTFKKFQNDHNVKNSFNNVPHFVTSVIHKATAYIILSDLRNFGFELHDREVSMNMEHMKLLFSTYAKFHALSFGLRHKDPKLFGQLTENRADIWKDFIVLGDLMPTIIDVLNDAKRLIKEDDLVLEKYQQIINKAPYVLLEMIDPSDPYNVITHGDCWNNNQMFKYAEEGKKKPTDVRLLDFQCGVLAPVAYDLSYVLFASGSQECLDGSEGLLQIYYETLSEHLIQLECDPNELFPKEHFKLYWQKYSIWGFVFTIYILKLVLIQGENINDAGDGFQSDALKEIISAKGSPIYEERIRKTIRYYTQHLAP